jgi:hypothetical protein
MSDRLGGRHQRQLTHAIEHPAPDGIEMGSTVKPDGRTDWRAQSLEARAAESPDPGPPGNQLSAQFIDMGAKG